MTNTKVNQDDVTSQPVIDVVTGAPDDAKSTSSVKTDSETTNNEKLRSIPGGRARTRKDTPPKRPNARGSNSTKDSPEMPYKAGAVAEGMKRFYAQIGMMWGMFDPHCATVVVENAEKMAESMERLAKESPAVRRVLDSFITTTAWGEVIGAHLPVVAAVAMHHIPAIRDKFNPPNQANPNDGMPPTANTRTA